MSHLSLQPPLHLPLQTLLCLSTLNLLKHLLSKYLNEKNASKGNSTFSLNLQDVWLAKLPWS